MLSVSGSSGQLMGLDRKPSKPDLRGYTEEEMCAEAQARLAHNRQRRRMKQLMNAASDDGTSIATKDLLLAAKLAKMNLPDEMVADTPYAMVRVRPESVAIRPRTSVAL